MRVVLEALPSVEEDDGVGQADLPAEGGVRGGEGLAAPLSDLWETERKSLLFEKLPKHLFCSPAVRVLPALLGGPLYEVREVRLARHEEHDAAARSQVRQEVERLAQVQRRLVQVEDGSVEAPAKEELAHPGVNCAISVALERRGIFAMKTGTAFPASYRD